MTREQISLRIGAVCVIFGSVIVFVSRTFLHGDLPTKTGEAALSYVASHPIYPLVHPGRCARCPPLGGPVALSGSLMHRVAWAIGRLGAASVLVGAAVHIVDFSIDGYALPTLADAWALTSPSGRPDLGFGARLMLVAIGGPSTIALIVLRGSTIILYGWR